MRIKWWHWVLLILGSMMVVGGTFFGFVSGQIKWPPPKFNEDEVEAMVKHDLLELEVISSPSFIDFSGYYVGDGKWSGICQGYYSYEENVTIYEEVENVTRQPGEKLLDYLRRKQKPIGSKTETVTVKRNLEWNFYEKSQTTEVVGVRKD